MPKQSQRTKSGPRYTHPKKHKRPTFRLSYKTFIDRLLSHVPEKGTHIVRSYGCVHMGCFIQTAVLSYIKQGINWVSGPINR
ncbi:MAG: hypothetical protein HOK67_16780 [Deltaproteobacteria bacterium]|nr:hypothetical protein [Deltaproteobacteria bacterium]